MKFVFYLLLSCFIFVSQTLASEADLSYEEHLALLQSQGYIDEESVQEKIFQRKLKNTQGHSTAKARGIASTLSEKKVIYLENKAIEINP